MFLWCQFKIQSFEAETALVQDMTFMSNELLNSQSTMVEAELTLPMIAKEQVVSCSLAGPMWIRHTNTTVAGLMPRFLPTHSVQDHLQGNSI